MDLKEIEALKQISKLVRKKGRRKFKKHERTGNAQKAIQTWVKKRDKKLEYGIKPKGFYAGFFEVGTVDILEDSFLEDVVKDNLEEIIKIEEEFMGKL